jgi:hypothetical protein
MPRTAGPGGSLLQTAVQAVTRPVVDVSVGANVRYSLVKAIAKGGMGEIHLAKDGELEREVAVKVSTVSEGAVDPRFTKEARVLANLAHPNIVPIHTTGGWVWMLLSQLRGTWYLLGVPTISRFYGMKIQMLFRDHNPPHFHVEYGEFTAVFEIRTLGLLDGNLPPKAQALVVEWASAQRDALMQAWDAASAGKLPPQIAPLE